MSVLDKVLDEFLSVVDMFFFIRLVPMSVIQYSLTIK